MTNEVAKKNNEIDMSQFRHKRNIKYLEKWSFIIFNHELAFLLCFIVMCRLIFKNKFWIFFIKVSARKNSDQDSGYGITTTSFAALEGRIKDCRRY